MASIRRRLRLWAAVWLLLQAASLPAIAARNCCAVHRSESARDEPSCHKNVTATTCPMPAADGTPCPMHKGDGAAGQTRERCVMRGTCDGPMAALFPTLGALGILPDVATMMSDTHADAAAAQTLENLIRRLTPPDTPPPRA
jgi:hypothetical protein